jgi:hypothetical protein
MFNTNGITPQQLRELIKQGKKTVRDAQKKKKDD